MRLIKMADACLSKGSVVEYTGPGPANGSKGRVSTPSSVVSWESGQLVGDVTPQPNSLLKLSSAGGRTRRRKKGKKATRHNKKRRA